MRTMLFVKNSRVLDTHNKVDDILQEGYYVLKDDGTADFYSVNYDARLNKMPTNSIYRHPTYFPGKPPGYFQLPTATKSGPSLNGKWVQDPNGILKITIGLTVHQWKLDPTDNELWQPAGVTLNVNDGSNIIQGVHYNECRGYMVEAPYSSSTLLQQKQLPTYFIGEEQTLISGAKAWIKQPVSWHVSWFVEGKFPMIGYKAFDAATRGGLWKFSSFMFNYHPNRLVAYSSGGYDYNKNQAADEEMHAFRYYLIFKNNMVHRMLGVQHFRQVNGYPILSVIQYHS